jgi:hypothetical protein
LPRRQKIVYSGLHLLYTSSQFFHKICYYPYLFQLDGTFVDSTYTKPGQGRPTIFLIDTHTGNHVVCTCMLYNQDRKPNQTEEYFPLCFPQGTQLLVKIKILSIYRIIFFSTVDLIQTFSCWSIIGIDPSGNF